MAGFFAVMTAMLLAMGISIAYALVLRELRQINANLEQFIGLAVDARVAILLTTTQLKQLRNSSRYRPRLVDGHKAQVA